MVRSTLTRRSTSFAYVLVWLLLGVSPFEVAVAETQYVYDDLGRLVLTVYSDGTAIGYEHDANGNVIGVHQWATEDLTIESFSPSNGPAGAQVTISGSGFNPSAGQNVVSFGGALATVNSASTSSLIVTVPWDAQSGPISVTAGGDTATSSESFVVQRPSITSFGPAIVNPGDAVSVDGANLNLDPGSTFVSVASTAANLISLTNSQAVFEAPVASGRIVVDTSYGQAASASDLRVVPNSIDAENVIDASTLDPGIAETLSIDQAGKYGIFEFDAIQGQRFGLKVTSLSTVPAGSNISYELFSPTGTSLMSGTLSSAITIDLPEIATTGRHLVAFTTGSSSTFDVSARIDLYAELVPGNSPLEVVGTVSGETRRFVFDATVGDNLGLGLTELTLSGSAWMRIYVYRPDGSQWRYLVCYPSNQPGCTLDMRDAPETGEYSIVIDPNGGLPSYTLTLAQHVDGGTLAMDTPRSIAMAVPGQRGLFDFTATAGQTVALNMDSIVTTPTGESISMHVYNPAGSVVGSTSSTGANKTLDLTNLAAGTYTVLLSPSDAATGSAQVELATGLLGTVPDDGTSQSFSATVPGQLGHFTFNATAGDDLGLALTELTLSDSAWMRIYVYLPDGSQWRYLACYPSNQPGCTVNMRNAPVTGEYSILIDPNYGLASYTLTLSHHVDGGTLTLDTPQSIAMAVPGQRGLFDFTATAGQTVALNMDSVLTTPTGESISMHVYNAAGSLVTNTSSTGSSKTLNLTNLAAGTYTVLLSPSDAATGSAQVELVTGLVGTIPGDGTSQSFSATVPGQLGYFTFNATAGDNIGLALTELTLSDSVWMRIYVYLPDGSQWRYLACYPYNQPGCTLDMRNAPATGEYAIVIDPNYGLASYTLTLSHHVDGGTLALDTPQSIAMAVPGQRGLFNFTATAGQTVALTLDSVLMALTGESITMRVYNGAGGQVGITSSTGSSSTLNLTNLAAGTYTVLLSPSDAATGSAQVELQ